MSPVYTSKPVGSFALLPPGSATGTASLLLQRDIDPSSVIHIISITDATDIDAVVPPMPDIDPTVVPPMPDIDPMQMYLTPPASYHKRKTPMRVASVCD